jgi:hypothetical protein
VIRTFAPLPSGICSPLSGLKLQRSFSPRFDSLVFVGLKKTKSNYLLSIARENAKEHKHNNDDDDDPKDSADRKKHSKRCKHSRLQVGVSVSSLLVGLRNGKLSRAVVARGRSGESLEPNDNSEKLELARPQRTSSAVPSRLRLTSGRRLPPLGCPASGLSSGWATARCRAALLTRGLLNTIHQILGQVSGSFLRLIHDALCLARE